MNVDQNANPNPNVNTRLITANNSNLNDVNINAITREFLTANPEYGVINIQDFINNPNVIHNPSGENYATSLQILLPWAETVTPIETKKVAIFKLGADNTPEEVLDELDIEDDATLVGENESFEVEKGDVVLMVEKHPEDDPTTSDKDEKTWWNKAAGFIANGTKTIFNGGKQAATYVWKHGGSQIVDNGVKIGIGLVADYLTGGHAASAITGATQKLLTGPKTPLLIEAPVAEGTKGQLLPWPEVVEPGEVNPDMRSGTRDGSTSYPDITNETELYINPERFVQVSSSVVKMPTGFWTNLENRRRQLNK